MAEISKIVKAFKEPLPVQEQWYQNRINACLSCEYNTKNMDADQVPFLEKLKINPSVGKIKIKPLCPAGSCLFCGCCVDRKSATKSESCAIKKVLEDKNYAEYKIMLADDAVPKWESAEVSFATDAKITCFSEDDTVILSRDSRHFVVEFKEFKPLVETTFRVVRTPSFDFKSFSVACGCTVPEATIIDSKTVEFRVRISTQGFREGINDKIMSIHYYKNNVVNTIPVKFLINKA